MDFPQEAPPRSRFWAELADRSGYVRSLAIDAADEEAALAEAERVCRARRLRLVRLLAPARASAPRGELPRLDEPLNSLTRPRRALGAAGGDLGSDRPQEWSPAMSLSRDANAPMSGLDHEQIVKLTGPLDPGKLAGILAVRPSAGELEEAVAWAAGASDIMGRLRRPLSGRVARLFDILTADRTLEEPD
jgi:hypothetical protein